MANIVDYLEKNKDILFSEKEFNALDALVLARLSYVNFKDLLKETKYRSKRHIIDIINDILMEKEHGKKRLRIEEDGKLLQTLRHSLRYKDLYVKSFVISHSIEEVKQFGAVTFLNDTPNNKFMYVSFKGTDGTVTGWKEDFNMAYLESIPAQIDAAKYLRKITRFSTYKRIYVGGHSKGGNLAIYASSKLRSSVQNNIETIYSFDGPGFKSEFFLAPSYQNIKDKINLYTPHSSVIGRLLEKDYKTFIVDSKKTLLYQHNIYNWQVVNSDFVLLEKYSMLSNKIDKTLKDNLEKMSLTERQAFVEELFGIVNELSEDDVINFGNGVTDFFKRFKKVLKTKSEATQTLIKSVFNLSKEEVEIERIEPIKNDGVIKSKVKTLLSTKIPKRKTAKVIDCEIKDFTEETSDSNILKIEQK